MYTKKNYNPMKPRVKICCISSVEEALTAIKYGASALGLVGNMPSGPGVIDDTLFLLTSETKPIGLLHTIKGSIHSVWISAAASGAMENLTKIN